MPPPATLLPCVTERVTKLGALLASAAVQFMFEPPLLVTVNGKLLCPVVVLMVAEPGPTASAGVAPIVSVIATACGLPAMVTPPLLAANETLPV